MSDAAISLQSMYVVTICVNVPGPAAASRLNEMGASVTKVEPPDGDPLARSNPAWYAALADGQEVIRLDLKDPEDRAGLDERLASADLLLTSSRPAALERLGLGPEKLRSAYPRLAQVAIVGHPSPHENEPGHDLTYLADLGLLTPPDMPRTLLADLAGAERAVSAALALLLERERGGEAGSETVALSEAAAFFAAPLHHGITQPGAHLGGGFPGYNLYRASDGWVAVAALEAHFWKKLLAELHLDDADHADLAKIFAGETANHWEEWAAEHDLPLKALSQKTADNLNRKDRP